MNDRERATADIAQRQALRKQVAMWSDRIQPKSADLAKQHRELLGQLVNGRVVRQRIGNAQLAGLNNMAQAAPKFANVRTFVRHQGDKADRAGLHEVTDYWKAIGKVLDDIEKDAWTLSNQAGMSVPPKNSSPKDLSEALNDVCLMLAQEWVQHFAAHSLMIAPKREG